MSLLALGNLLIWLPGLLFLVSLIYLSRALKKGVASRPVQFAPLGFLVIALVMAVVVPRQGIADALSFANAHEAHAGAPVSSYVDIDYAARDAWFRTALPPEEQGDAFVAGAELVHKPMKGWAWMLLVLSLIVGSLFFLQDIKGFVSPRK